MIPASESRFRRATHSRSEGGGRKRDSRHGDHRIRDQLASGTAPASSRRPMFYDPLDTCGQPSVGRFVACRSAVGAELITVQVAIEQGQLKLDDN